VGRVAVAVVPTLKPSVMVPHAEMFKAGDRTGIKKAQTATIQTVVMGRTLVPRNNPTSFNARAA
jgi:hypothetical protein